MRPTIACLLAGALSLPLLPAAAASPLTPARTAASPLHEAIVERAEAEQPHHPFAGVYRRWGETLYIDASGRWAEVTAGGCSMSWYESWTIGRWSRDGARIELIEQGTASRGGSHGEARSDAFRIEPGGERRQLWLAELPQQPMLFADDALIDAANMLNRGGTLSSWLGWRRQPLSVDDSDDEATEWRINDPGVRAALPPPLLALLRDAPLHARIVRVLDTPQTLQWSDHRATVTVELDRGSDDGLFEGMQLSAADDLHAVVTAVTAQRATATIDIERFHPLDPLLLPPTGVLLGSRDIESDACARPQPRVQAVVTAMSVDATDPIAFDDEGYAWVEAEIDRGHRHGLEHGLRVDGDDWHYATRARFVHIDADSARMQLRIRQPWRDQPPELPQIGSAVVVGGASGCGCGGNDDPAALWEGGD